MPTIFTILTSLELRCVLKFMLSHSLTGQSVFSYQYIKYDIVDLKK